MKVMWMFLYILPVLQESRVIIIIIIIIISIPFPFWVPSEQKGGQGSG